MGATACRESQAFATETGSRRFDRSSAKARQRAHRRSNIDRCHDLRSGGGGRTKPVPLYSSVQGVSIRAFKESVGLSPYQYILSERVRRAKELLSKGDLPVSDVALAAGFHNAYQMNRVFRKLVGLTPTALRRQTGVVSP
ncbi:MAG TPA: helix-turn-helix transcriptional regulator [Bradyrhizobium sp.]|uniref:helix-turn-helix domain-containing protein n=1 Tax=Bradyrhizobium sp. TaxID=376 RepID=UPI002B59121C|nr:helix-turn-helix transcriptional regulator [Bradyrhizobium sp.]HXB80681.1 helix-turn-helix transcriptional regulator [Bradyrhizobium sp.]